MSYTNTTTGDTWCSQFKGLYNNVEVLAGNHDTGEENGTAATRSYERYVTGCPHTLATSPPICGPVVLNCYGKEYYFDYPAVSPIARFIMISPVVFNVTGVCSATTKCNSAFGSPCDDLHGCWAYNKFDPHYNWVSNSIDSARTAGVKWVIVGMHKVCIAGGDQNCNIGPDLLNLMISKKVDLVLEGHDHSYQRSKQLALNTSTCTGIATASSYPIYNSNCVVNDGSAGVYSPGAGTVVVIQGTFGAPLNTVNDTSVNGGASAAEAPYFAKLMGTNTPGNGHGFMQYTVSADRIDAKSSFSGSFSDSFTIGTAFSLSSNPPSLVIQAGSSATSTITIASQGGFTGTVNLSLSQTGCACTSSLLNPTSVDLTTGNPSASATLQVGGNFFGNVTLIVTGSSGAISFSTQVAVSVQDFSISNTKPSLTLNFNASDTSTINLASQNNFAGTITLAPTSSPPGLTFSLSPLSVPIPSKGSGSATLSVTGSAPGNYTVTVGATSGPTSHATIVKVRVLGDFTMSTTKTALTLSPGSIDSSIIITLIGSGRYSGTVNLATAVTPSGPTASPGSPSLKLKATTTSDGTNSTILTINAGMVSGTYTINITATSGLLSHSTIVTLTVTKANPTITTALSSSTVSAGGSVGDSALLAGATSTAGGTVTYRIFSGTICSGTPVFVQTVSVTGGAVPSSKAVQFNVTGSYEWQAIYSGDPNNNPPQPSSCGSEVLTVKPTTTTVSTTLSSVSIVPGGTVSDSATLAGFFGGFSTGGTATYSVFSGAVCTGTPVFAQTVNVNPVNGIIPNSRNVQFNTTGTFQWQVSYNGDTNNGVSTSLCGSESLSVGKASPSIATSLSANSIIVGNSVADTATVTGGTTPTGTVTFSVYSGSACSGTAVATKTVPLASGSAGPVNVIFNNTGTFNWQGVYNGDSSNNVASSACGTETLTVGKAAPSVAESISATTIIVGNSANANATVSGGFNPAGTITFSIFTGSSCSGTILTSKTMILTTGIAGPFSVIFNSTGTFNWQAVYNGDANNNPNISPCKSLVVGRATAVITTNLSSISITVGSSVSDSASMTSGFQATGTVTYSFFTGGSCSGTGTPAGSPVTVTGGVVPSSISQAFNTAGPYSWNAAYSGDANNNPATSPCEPLTVSKANPAIATLLSQNSIPVGSSVTDSATLTNSFQASGTVTYRFFSGSTCTGTGTVVGSPVAVSNGIVPNSASQTFNTAGPYSWNAAYSGDTNNNLATSVCEPLAINPKGVSIATNLSSTTVTVGSSVFDSATMTGATGTAGGTMTYNLFTGGTCSGSSSAVSAVTVTNAVAPNSRSVIFNSTASASWNAVYSGDANNSGASSACEPLTVNKTSPTIATSLSGNPIIVGQSVTTSATLMGSFQAGGSVSYFEFSTGTCSGSSAIVSTVTVTNGVIPSSSAISPVPSGTYGFEASYSGDANNSPMTSSCSPLTVNKSGPTVTTSLSQLTIPVGSSVSDSASMTGGFQPGGTVSYMFFSGGSCSGTSTVVGSPVTVSNGVVPSSSTQGFNNAGSYSWNAAYNGDANNNAITSPCEPLTVSKASPVISTTLSTNPITVGGSVSDSAAMTGGFQAGGTVVYSWFTGDTCSGAASIVSTVGVVNGVIPSSTARTFNSAGPYSWNAAYSGDANNNGSPSGCEPLTVSPTSGVTLSTTLSSSIITVGGSVTDSSTLTGVTPGAGGTVIYNSFQTAGCTGTSVIVSTVTVANGGVPGSASKAFNSAGAFSWNAVYSGDANNGGATSACELLTVNQAAPSVTTTVSGNNIPVGTSVHDSATLSNGFNAGGSMTYTLFSDAGCTISGVIISSVTVTNGVVPDSAATAPTPAGAYGFQASYNGDANNKPVAGACEPLNVLKASVGITTSLSQTTILVGTPVSDSATMTAGYQPGGTVTYMYFSGGSCTGTSTAVGSPVTVTNGIVPASTSQGFNSAGSYSWNAVYNGDANNNPTTSPCEPLTVSKATPSISTNLSSNPVTVGGSVSDFATMAGGFQAGGSATYFLFSTVDCTGFKNQVSVVTVSNGVIPSSSSQTFNSAGADSWNVGYSGDANNNASTSPCEPLTVNKASPIVTTTLSQNVITVGNSVSDSVTISNGFQAGGTVAYSFYTGSTCSGIPTIVGSPVTVTNGAAPSSVLQPFNTAGSFGWNAAYSGDSNNGAATSACEPLTVNPKGVAITTSLSSTTIVVGSSAYDSAILTGSTSNAGGTVTYNLFSNGMCSGTFSIISQVTVASSTVPNSRSVIFNSTTAFSWNAGYSGDANNAQATSVCEPLTINKDSPTIATTSSAPSGTVGSAFHDSVTLSGAYNAGGTVTYSIFSNNACSGNGASVGNPVIVTGGIVPDSVSTTPSPAGPYSFQASYSGDANNNAVLSACEPFLVTKASPIISTALTTNPIAVGESTSDSATVAGGFIPGGTVTYSYFQGSVCAGPGTTVGLPVTMTGGVVPSSSSQTFSSTGPYSWNAVYNGDTNNNALASTCEPLTVNKASPVISTTLSANPITVGGSVSDSATMTSGFQAGGTVTYNWFTGNTCSGTANAVSTASVVSGNMPSSLARTFNSAGPYSWNAVYSGDSNNNGGASSCEPLTVNPTTGITISTTLSSSSITVGGSVADSATLTGVTSGAGGTVTYNSFLTASCTGTPAVVSTVTVTNGAIPGSAAKAFNSAGSFSWSAIYSGDANNGGATSLCEPLTVNQAAPSITTTVSGNNVPIGTLVHDSSTLSNGANAGGTVTYTLFSDAGCTVSGVVVSTVPVTNGVVPDSQATGPPTAGAYSFQASYSGDANNKPVTGACEPFNILKASPGVTTSLSLTTIPVGSSVSDSATMTGGYQPGGIVTYVFFVGSSCTGSSTTVGSPVAVTNGVVPGSAPSTFNSAGAYGWSAVYSGDANNNAVTSSCEPLTVNKTGPVVSTTLSANPVAVGSSVYDSAAMTGAFQAGGSATYFVFTTSDCTGSATTLFTVTVNNGAIPSSSPQQFTSAGSFSWNARYFGDPNNNPATSLCETLTVNKANPLISTNLSANPVTVGGSVSDFATMTGGFQAGGSATYFLFSTADCTGSKTQVSVVSVSNGVIPSSIPQTFNNAGSYSWNLGYAGDANNNATTSLCEPLSVSKASPSISTNLSQNVIVVGGSVSDSATITNGFQASGAVTYSYFTGSTCSGVPTVVGTSVTVSSGSVPGSASQPFNTAGPFSWNAAYSGDANNNIATSACEPLTVNPKGVAIATSLSAATITVGGSVFDSAVLTGATSNAGGTVTYNSFLIGSCTGTPGLVSTVTVTNGAVLGSASKSFNSAGSFSWDAVYSGDANNSPATSLCEPLTVNKATPTLTTTVSAPSAPIGSAFHDSATLTGAFTAGGTVSYNTFNNNVCSGSSTPVGSPVTVASGVVPDSVPMIPPTAGLYSFQASYSGDTNNNAALSVCEPFSVNKITPTVATTLSANSIAVGGSTSDSATITNGFNVGGTVTYSYFQNSNCAAPSTTVGIPMTITSGVVPSSSSQTFSSAGPYSWNAAYNGDANNNAVPSACEPLTVNKALPTITTTLSQNPITVGGSVFDSATIASGFQAGGFVNYDLFTGSTCNGALTVLPAVTVINGQVQNSVSQVFNSAGSYSWNAVYSGDTNNNAATSTCEPLTVNPTSGVAIFTVLSSSTITVGGSVSDSASLTGVASGAGGAVTYNSFQTASCSGTPGVVSTVNVANGNVPGSASKTFSSAGSFSWNAVYSGDANNSPATSLCEPLTVNKTSPSIFTSLSTNLITVGQSISESASLTGSFQAGGSVTYLEFSTACSGNSVSVSSVTVTNNVIPSSSPISPAASGTYGFEASYSGDSNNSPITSSCSLLLTVAKASPTITSGLSANVISVGSSVSDSATMTGGFQTSGTVTYTLYTGTSCSGVQTATSTVSVTSNGIPSSSPANPDSIGSWSWKAAYSGDANNFATFNCVPLSVTKTTPTITSNLAFLTISVGDSVTDSATLALSFQAGGTVTYSFFSGSTCVGTATIVGSPVAVTNGIIPDSAPQSFTLAGLYSWKAAYSGDTNNNLATSICEPLTVVQAASDLTLLPVAATTVGNSMSFSATLLVATSNVGGTITYYVYSDGNCQTTLTAVSVVSVTSRGVQPSRSYQFTSAGTFSWNAIYSGDPNNAHATSLCGPLTIGKATPTVSATISATPVNQGSGVSASATLNGGFKAGGTATYELFSSSDCTGTPTVVSTVTVANNAVPASSSQTFSTAGKFSWSVSYHGDSNNSPATSPCKELDVTTPPVLTVPGAQSVNSGSPINFTVTATDPSWNNITLTASGLPPGASFPASQSFSGSASSTFTWTPSNSQGSADYKVTFTVDDGHGGKTSSQVTIHVSGISQTPPLNNAIPYFVIALVAGTAVVLAVPLVLRRFRK